MTLKVYLAGEGPTELGGWYGDPAHRTTNRGVLEALLRKVRSEGWEICGATTWRSVRKLRVGGAAHADVHNVLGVINDAKEAHANVVVFSRDRDNDRDRQKAIEDGIARAEQVLGGYMLAIAGGIAVPAIEGWILALLGVTRTESMSTTKAKDELSARAMSETTTLTTAIEAADMRLRAADAPSLTTWLERAAAALR